MHNGETIMKRFGLILVATLALLPTQRARGQDALFEAGARVRVRAVDAGAFAGSTGSGTRFVGHLARIAGDSLWIQVGSTDGPLVSIDRANIHELEISDGRKRNPGKGALWGAGVGLGLGVLAVAALDDCTMGHGSFWFDFCEGEGGRGVGSARRVVHQERAVGSRPACGSDASRRS
jgi:hypothetical protein